jgi:YfiH family protein
MNIIKMPNINLKHGFITDKSVIFEDGNREEIFKKIGTDIVMLKQQHTANIVEVTNENIDYLKFFYNDPTKYIIGDGLITQLKNVALSCFTADCACIFLYAQDIKTIAIVHSGWAGTFEGINEQMIIKIQQKGANLQNLAVAIAPSISQQSYQVGDEFYEKFILQNKDSQEFFTKINNKWYYDNAGYIAAKYKKYNINNIFINKQDTYRDEKLFSHRYYTHFGKKNGRMLGFIIID